jgi:hypothetical protein
MARRYVWGDNLAGNAREVYEKDGGEILAIYTAYIPKLGNTVKIYPKRIISRGRSGDFSPKVLALREIEFK